MQMMTRCANGEVKVTDQSDTGPESVRATSGNMNKQKTRENLRNIYVMNEYVHT